MSLLLSYYLLIKFMIIGQYISRTNQHSNRHFHGRPETHGGATGGDGDCACDEFGGGGRGESSSGEESLIYIIIKFKLSGR